MAMESYRAQGMDAGTAEILEIEKDNPEVAGWAKFDLREAEFQQCDICKTLKFDDLALRTGYNLHEFGQEQHESWDAVKTAAESGCHTCRLIHLVKLHEKKKKSSSYTFRNSMTHIRVTRDGSSVIVNGEATMGVRFAWSTLPDCPGDQLSDSKENGTTSSRFVEDNPGSDEAFSRAKTWIGNCLAEHQFCKTNDNVPLPTRVLDIGTADETGQVKLMETDGQTGKYVALSHCWGGISKKDEKIIRTCVTSNYAELKAGFAVSRMPRNFQDAIIVATQLGVRYLWIDSFCIIQDSPDDWSRESLRMSEVYGNSFLTIYASSAENSDTGFLRPRDPERYLMTKLCPVPKFPGHWIWIRWPTSDLVWSLTEIMGRLWHRSWAFQELVLPPRILEYSKLMMHWRCNKQHIEELSRTCEVHVHDGYKELMWILGLPDTSNPPSEAIPSHHTFAHSHENISIYSRWYQMIEGFGGRELTNERDKLPAISGLASKVQQITGDVYMAGLWKRDIAAGLCWGARFHKDVTRPSTYIAPSWSWASTQGDVKHQFGDDRKFEIEVIDFNFDTEPLNPLGQVFSGSITVSGHVRKFDPTQNTVDMKEEWDYETSKLKLEVISDGEVKKYGRVHQYALKDQKDVVDPLGSGIVSLSLDIGSPVEVAEMWLLKLVLPQIGQKPPKPEMSKLIPDGIILEKISEGEEVYRRIGVFACLDAMAEWVVGPENAALLGWERKALTIV